MGICGFDRNGLLRWPTPSKEKAGGESPRPIFHERRMAPVMNPRVAFDIYRSMPGDARARIAERVGTLSAQDAEPIFVQAVEEELAAIESAHPLVTKH